MFQSDAGIAAPQLDFEAWRDTLRTMCGRYNPEGSGPDAFAGWVSPLMSVDSWR